MVSICLVERISDLHGTSRIRLDSILSKVILAFYTAFSIRLTRLHLAINRITGENQRSDLSTFASTTSYIRLFSQRLGTLRSVRNLICRASLCPPRSDLLSVLGPVFMLHPLCRQDLSRRPRTRGIVGYILRNKVAFFHFLVRLKRLVIPLKLSCTQRQC